MRTDLLRRLAGTPTRKALIYHALASVGAIIVIAVLATVLTDRLARQEAERYADWTGRGLAQGLIAPLVTPGVRAGDPAELATLDRVVRSRIASSTVVRVKVWAPDGTVLYSDANALIGRRYELDEDDLQILRNGGIESGLSDGTGPENVYERDLGQLVEVYARAVPPDGDPVLVESYYTVEHLNARADELQGRFLPVVLLALVLLELLLLPLSVWLSRRAERSERERQAAERQAAAAVVAERRRLAAELHDGVIQDLSAVGYALHMVTRRLEAAGEDELGETVDRTADIVRMDVMTLRGLMSALYTTPDEGVDLGGAIRDLVAALGRHGVTARLDPLPALPGAVASAVFQVAREALRNAVRHSGATPHLTLGCRERRLTLSVTDDGCGYDPERAEGPDEGHLGLSLLRDAARRVGGQLETRTAPGAGTTVTLTVDLDAAAAACRGVLTDSAASTPDGVGASLSASAPTPH